MKRMKDKAFARGVSRDDLRKGADELGLPLEAHITNEPIEEINDWDRAAVEADAEEAERREGIERARAAVKGAIAEVPIAA